MSVITLPHGPDDRRRLQIAVALAACVPVGAGLAGVLLGPHMAGSSGDPSLDSHYRYLSGLLLGLGVAFWSLIPSIERHTPLVRVLTAMVVLGGLGRAFSLHEAGLPSAAMRLALLMELIVTPALCWWQGRVARHYTQG